jgi:hypothetical protein
VAAGPSALYGIETDPPGTATATVAATPTIWTSAECLVGFLPLPGIVAPGDMMKMPTGEVAPTIFCGPVKFRFGPM